MLQLRIHSEFLNAQLDALLNDIMDQRSRFEVVVICSEGVSLSEIPRGT